MSNKLLDAVRNAERIRSTAYDPELQIYINSALYDMKRLNIVFNEEDPEDEVISAVICFVKANMGTSDVKNKEHFKTMYNDFIDRLRLDSSKMKAGD